MSSDSPIVGANPKASYLSNRVAILAAIEKVLEGGTYILGSEVSTFEEEFASYIGSPSAVGVGSGTDAVVLALRGCGVMPGDRVVTVSHTAVATVAAIHLAGAIPVLVDVDPATHTMDPNRLESALKNSGDKYIRAVIPVHLYGHPAAMPELLEIAQKHGILVIEDCAQSHGALIGTRATGSFGHAGAFSFYPTKNLGAFGDGGACVCSDPKILDQMRLVRQYGWRQRYLSEIRGMNTRLDEVQAAILRVKLGSLDASNNRRREIAGVYSARLRDTGLQLPIERSGCHHVFHQYVVRTPQRDALRSFLQQRGVMAAVLYPVPVHLQAAYDNCIEIGPGGLSTTEQLCREVLSLPLYPELSDEAVDKVCDLILEFASTNALS